jgi:NAD(P)-dependent dehydrogenase (short-subunit alcohol dehydrogenase family)
MVHSERDGSIPTCVIAGAGVGLGVAVAERYAREGFAVYALSRSPDLLADPVSRLRSRGLNITAIECLVGNAESVECAMRNVEADSGSCDVLVYNAFVEERPATTRAPQRILDELALDVTGAVAFVNLVIEKMRVNGRGALVFSAYGSAEYRGAGSTFLSVGRAAVLALVDRFAKELERVGIRVGMVTIDGALPSSKAELDSLAQLYWDVFFVADCDYERERRFRTSLPFRS